MNRIRRFAAWTLLSLAAVPAAAPAHALCTSSPLQGTWVSVNSQTRGITRAEIVVGCCDQVLNGQLVCSPPDRVRLFGRCHPTDCDWGSVSGHLRTADGRGLHAVYDQGFARRDVTITRLPANRIRIRIFNDFVAPGRPDYTSTETMRRP